MLFKRISILLILLVIISACSLSEKSLPDSDGDGHVNATDNCPQEANPTQADLDGDGEGDICDMDIDGDGFINEHEIIAKTNPKDPTSKPDLNADNDRDGIPNKDDKCPFSAIGKKIDETGCEVAGIKEMTDNFSDEINLNSPHTEPMIPKWGFGYMQSGWGDDNYGYDSQTGFIEHAKALRGIDNKYGNHKYPADIMVLDMYWTGKEWSWPENMTWDLQKFPDPQALVKQLHEMNFKLMMNYHEGGFGDEWLKQLQRDLDYGLDIVWLDFWRGDSQYEKQVWELLKKHHGSNKRLMMMARHYARPNHHNQEAILGGDYMRTPDEEEFEKNMPIHWTGDVLGNWQGFAETINAIVYSDDGAMGGWSYLHSDTPGHTMGEDKELALRWVQFSDFTTGTRNHGITGRDVWSWGKEVEKLSYDSRLLRYRLLPYIYTYAWQIWDKAIPLTRPLRYAFPGEDDDNPYVFMFGDELLVAPVYKAANDFPNQKMDIYLPKGKNLQWVDYWTHEILAGGSTIKRDVRISEHPKTPLFVKRGSIIPMGPEIFHIDPAIHADPITLDIYPLVSGTSTFTLYDDDGESLDYQRGKQSFTKINVNVNSSDLNVNVGETKGEYAGKPDAHNYVLKINLQKVKPRLVTLNQLSLTRLEENRVANNEEKGWYYDNKLKTLWVSFSTSAEVNNNVIVSW